MKFLLYLLYFLFFSLGAGSLILEMVWTKIGTVIVGSTVSAAALVLSCYLSGLAAGAFFFGRQADVHPAYLLRRLGFLQFGIAIGSLLSLSLFIAASSPWFLHLPPAWMSCIFCIAMLVPTLFMGGTFPVISKYLSTLRQDHARTNRDIGGLYAVNVLGASTGALLGGFYLLESFGAIASALTASCLYAMIGCIFFFLQKTVQPNPSIANPAVVLPPAVSLPPIIKTAALSSTAKNLLLVFSGIAGFALFSYEMLYSRVLSLFWSSTIYSFSIVIAAFLAGSGCGSAAAAWFVSAVKKRPGPLKNPLFLYFCVTAIATGISVLGSCILWPNILSLLDSVIRVSPSHVWRMTMLSKALASTALIFVPSFFLGALFIVLVKTYTTKAMTGKNIGTLYAVNTIGGIAGAIVAGFVFIPLIGAFKGLVITTLLLFTAAGACITLCSSYFSRLQVLFLCVLIAAGAGLAAFSRSPYAPRGDERTVYFKEGAAATVKITDAPDGTRKLFCNNREEGNTGLDPVRYARIEALLPLLLHPAPRQVLIIGMGAGISAGEACQYPATGTVRCVEI
jgi:spermidine synthase